MRPMSRAAPLIIALVSLFAAACNRPGCDETTYDPQTNDPVITHMSLLGQQSGDPWTLLLSMSFESPPGTAGNGNVLFYVESLTPAPPKQLNTFFDASNVQRNAPSGTIVVPLTFVQVGIDYDATVRLGTRIVDTNNRPSNCYSLDINFQLTNATAFLRRAWRREGTHT